MEQQGTAYSNHSIMTRYVKKLEYGSREKGGGQTLQLSKQDEPSQGPKQ